MDQLSSNVAKALSELIEGSQQALFKGLEDRIDQLETKSLELTKENDTLRSSLETLTETLTKTVTESKEAVDKITGTCQNLTKENQVLKDNLNQVTQAKDMLAREQAEWMKLGTTLASSVRDLQTFTGELDSRLRLVQKQVIAAATSHIQPDPYRLQTHHPNEMILELSRQAGKLKGEIDVLNNLHRSFDHSSSSRNQSFTTTM